MTRMRAFAIHAKYCVLICLRWPELSPTCDVAATPSALTDSPTHFETRVRTGCRSGCGRSVQSTVSVRAS